MTRTFPLSKTQYARLHTKEQAIRVAQSALMDEYLAILAAHDVVDGQVSHVTETELTVTWPDPPAEATDV